MTQRAPRYAVRYEDTGLFKLALQRAGGNIDLIDIDVYQQGREVSTLPAAKSVKRALERRGHYVQGIFERINLRGITVESQPWYSDEYKALHRGEIEWEWDEEQEIDE